MCLRVFLLFVCALILCIVLYAYLLKLCQWCVIVFILFLILPTTMLSRSSSATTCPPCSHPPHFTVSPRELENSSTHGQAATVQHFFPDVLQWEENDMESWWGHTSSWSQNVQQNDVNEENERKKPDTKNANSMHPCLRSSKADQTYLWWKHQKPGGLWQGWGKLTEKGSERASLYLIKGEGHLGLSTY